MKHNYRHSYAELHRNERLYTSFSAFKCMLEKMFPLRIIEMKWKGMAGNQHERALICSSEPSKTLKSNNESNNSGEHQPHARACTWAACSCIMRNTDIYEYMNVWVYMFIYLYDYMTLQYCKEKDESCNTHLR